MHFDTRSTNTTVHGFKPAGQGFFSFLLSTLRALGACCDLESSCMDMFFHDTGYREWRMGQAKKISFDGDGFGGSLHLV